MTAEGVAYPAYEAGGGWLPALACELAGVCVVCGERPVADDHAAMVLAGPTTFMVWTCCECGIDAAAEEAKA